MKRSDGVLIKSLNPFFEIIPYIMKERSGSQNFFKQVFCADPIDKYISEKRKEGFRIDYLHIFLAAYVKVLSERPQLNRFIMNKRIYQRNNISISMVIKHSFDDEGEETTVKFEFTGKENIYETSKIINNLIAETKNQKNNTKTDKLAKVLMSTPRFVKNILVNLFMKMDDFNLLPKSVIQASPFHATIFFTHLKSLKANYVYHHLYDFGTTGLFVALGKTEKLPVVVDNQVVVKKCCQVGYTLDDRVCDGAYYVKSLKMLENYFMNPHLLETRN